jgi:MSHA pilin protein MshC
VQGDGPRGERNGSSALAPGYTLVELVLVIAILAIVAMFAVPRFFDTTTYQNRGYVDTLAAALRASSKFAVASGCPVQLQVTSAGYAAVQQAASGNSCNPSDATWATPVMLPDGSSLSGSAPATASPLPATYTFTSSGGLSAAAPTLAVGGWTLSVDPTTGYVSVGGGGP